MTSSSRARLRITTLSKPAPQTRRLSAIHRSRSLGYWLSAWWPVILAICVIVIESTAAFGADHTSGPFRWIWEHLFGRVSNARWALIHHDLRKTGHFLGYGTMGLLWLRAWWMTLPKAAFLLDAALALLGTAAVASLDEYHQSFLPNRTGIPSDVLLDCSGAVVLLLLYFGLRSLGPRRPSDERA
jgi:VanZ family protein